MLSARDSAKIAMILFNIVLQPKFVFMKETFFKYQSKSNLSENRIGLINKISKFAQNNLVFCLDFKQQYEEVGGRFAHISTLIACPFCILLGSKIINKVLQYKHSNKIPFPR